MGTAFESLSRPDCSTPPPAPLSDAEILERAAEVYARLALRSGAAAVARADAAKLRAAEGVDVFEAFERVYDGPGDDRLHALARSWFGPLDVALSQIEQHGNAYAARVAKDARAALRERARAAQKESQ